jgi:hypothetical protein
MLVSGSHRLAGVAQLVEQLIRNQQVTSSSLVAGSKSHNKFTIRRGSPRPIFGLTHCLTR